MTPRRLKSRTDSLRRLPGAWPGAAAGPARCPRRSPGRGMGLQSQTSLTPEHRRQHFFQPVSASALLIRTPLATWPAPLVCCRVSDRDSEELREGGGGWESAPGSRAVSGKPERPSRPSFFCSLRSLEAEEVAALFPSGKQESGEIQLRWAFWERETARWGELDRQATPGWGAF